MTVLRTLLFAPATSARHVEKVLSGATGAEQRFATSAATRLPPRRCDGLVALWHDPGRLAAMPVHEFMDIFAM
jgi:hypothetical protein